MKLSADKYDGNIAERMTDPLALARLLLATPQRERGPVHQDLVRAIRYDGPEVPLGKACLWLLPDGTTTGILRDAVRAWRIAAGGPTVGRPRTRPEPSGLPPGRQPSGRTRVRVQLYLDPEIAAWLRAQPGGQSAAVERWATVRMAEERALVHPDTYDYDTGIAP